MEAKVTLKQDGFPHERHIILPPDVAARAAALPVVRDLFPARLGHFPYASGHFTRRQEGVVEWIMIYCTAGEGWCTVEGRRRRLQQDTAIFVPANTPHAYGTTKRHPWTIYWVHISGRRVADYLRALQVSAEDPVLHLKHSGDLISHFEEMYHHLDYGNSPEVLMALSTSLAHFLGELNLQRRPANQRARTAKDNVLATIEFMNQNLSRSLTLEDLAQHARLSPSHYSAMFRRVTGYAPVTFFLRQKMLKAGEILRTQNRKVVEIATLLGFDDPYYFSRLFKRIHGQAPSHYGKQFQ